MKMRNATLLFAILVSLCSCRSSSASSIIDSFKPLLPTDEYESESSAKEDSLEKKNHIFEAEAARFIGHSIKNSKPMDGKCKAQSYFF